MYLCINLFIDLFIYLLNNSPGNRTGSPQGFSQFPYRRGSGRGSRRRRGREVDLADVIAVWFFYLIDAIAASYLILYRRHSSQLPCRRRSGRGSRRRRGRAC